MTCQWREKHKRRLNRMRGKAAALSLSTQEWKAKRFAPGARVISRHAGWERWVIYEADRCDCAFFCVLACPLVCLFYCSTHSKST